MNKYYSFFYDIVNNTFIRGTQNVIKRFILYKFLLTITLKNLLASKNIIKKKKSSQQKVIDYKNILIIPDWQMKTYQSSMLKC